MSNFITVRDEVISELKNLRKEILQINENESTFGNINLNEVISRQNAKNRILHLIEKI